MHYKCNLSQTVIPSASEESQNLKSTDSSPSAQNDNKDVGTKEVCDQRKDQLAKVYESKGKRKLIVVPRQNLDTNFALTAWTYLDKFNEFDEQRVTKFIDAHLNQGPEKTME